MEEIELKLHEELSRIKLSFLTICIQIWDTVTMGFIPRSITKFEIRMSFLWFVADLYNGNLWAYLFCERLRFLTTEEAKATKYEKRALFL